jgi:hypothetical protein
MVGVLHPALAAFVAELREELVLAQVLIRRSEPGYELRHVEDRQVTVDQLRAIRLAEARSLAQFTPKGAFRPLKSAPNLQTGWRLTARSDEELAFALNQIYPGAVADWFAARSAHPPVRHYREFTERQTGMYRITTMLDDQHAALVTRACCDKTFCLKRRLWTVQCLAPDDANDKSLIPCLEPCAILLEIARKAMRIEQQEKVHLELTPDEVRTVAAAIQVALAHPDPNVREADFSEPANPRRLKLVLEKLKPTIAHAPSTKTEEG